MDVSMPVSRVRTKQKRNKVKFYAAAYAAAFFLSVGTEKDPVTDHALLMEGLEQLLGGDVSSLLTSQFQNN